MPLPMMTPQRNGSSLPNSRPLSFTAEREAATANWAKRSSRLAVLRLDDGLRFEVLDLAAEVDLEGGGVELLDDADAAPAGAQPRPEAGNVRAERVNRAQAGDDDASGHFLACSFSM